MLDIKILRRQPDLVKESLKRRKMDPSVIDEVLSLDESRRDKIKEADDLKKCQKY